MGEGWSEGREEARDGGRGLAPPYWRAMPALPWLKASQMLPSCSSSIPTPLPTASPSQCNVQPRPAWGTQWAAWSRLCRG